MTGNESPSELLFGAYDMTRGFVPGDLLLVCIEGVSVPSMSIYRDIELMAKLSMKSSAERTQRNGVKPHYSTVKRRKRDSETHQARRSGLRIRWRGKGPSDFLFPAPKDIAAQIELKLFLLSNRNGAEDPETSYEDLLINRLEDTYGTATLRMRDIALTPEIHTLKLKVLLNGAENILSRESFVYVRTAVITAKTLQLKQQFSSLIADRAKIHADNKTDPSETKVSAVPRNKLTRVFLMLTEIRVVFEKNCRLPITYQELGECTWWICFDENGEPTQLSSAVFNAKESDAHEMKWTLQRTLIIDGTYPPDLDFVLTGGQSNGIIIGEFPEAKNDGGFITIDFQHTTKDTVKLEPIKERSESFQVYVAEDSEGNPINSFDRGTLYLKTIVADPEALAAPLVEMEEVEGFEEDVEEPQKPQKPIVVKKTVSDPESHKATHFLSIGILDANGLTNLSKDKINMFYRVVTTVASRRARGDPYDHDHIGVATTGPVRPETPSKSYFFTSKDLGTDAASRGLQSHSRDRIDWHSSSNALSSSWFNLTAHDLTGCSTIDILFDLKGEHDTEVMGASIASSSKFPTVFASGQLRLDEARLRMQVNQPIEVPVDLADGEGRFCGTLRVVLTHLVPAGLPGGQPRPEFAKDFKSRALVPYSRGQQLENLLDDSSYTPPTWVALVRFYGAKNLVAVKPPPATGGVATGGSTFYSDSSVDFDFTPRILMANSHAQTVLKQRQQVKVEAFGLTPAASIAVFEPLDYEYAQTAGNTFVCRFEPGESNDVTICAMRSFGQSDVVFGTAKVSLAKIFSRAAMAPDFKNAINEWFTLAPAKVSDVPAFRGEVNEGRPVYDVEDSISLSGQVGLSFKFLNCGMMDYFLTQEMVATAKRLEEERQKRANLVTRKLQTMWNQRMGAQAACLFLNNRLCPPIRSQKERERAQSMEKLGLRLEHAIRVTQYAWKLSYGNASKRDTGRQKKGNENPTDTFISFLKRQAVIYSLNRRKKADASVFGTKGVEDDARVQEDADQENIKRDQLVAMLQLRFMMRNLWQPKKPKNRLRRFVPQMETKMNLVTRMRGGGGAGTSKAKTNTVTRSNPFQKFFQLRKRQLQNLKKSLQTKSNRAEEQRKRNLVRFIQTGWLCSKHGKYDLLGLLRSPLLNCHAVCTPTDTVFSREGIESIKCTF